MPILLEFAPKLQALALPLGAPQPVWVHVVRVPVPVTEVLLRVVVPPEIENERSERRSARLAGAEAAVSINVIVTVPLPSAKSACAEVTPLVTKNELAEATPDQAASAAMEHAADTRFTVNRFEIFMSRQPHQTMGVESARSYPQLRPGSSFGVFYA